VPEYRRHPDGGSHVYVARQCAADNRFRAQKKVDVVNPMFEGIATTTE
jgi:hypothetical protein